MSPDIFDLGKIGITLGGEYDNRVVYEKLTIVLYKGKSYISTKITQGVSPEQDILVWQLIAEAKDAYDMLVAEGKTTLTKEEFLEQLVDATKGRYIIQGNVTNAADEEDLIVEHSDLLGIDTLKLANRPSTDGMGYIILRKNKSFAEQVTKENTIYEIRYDFTLTEDVTIPANCVLQFNGGSIKNDADYNYKVTGTSTKINTDIAYNIFDNTLGGGFELPYIDVRWVGGISDYDEIQQTGTDNAPYFERAINLIGLYYNGMHINLVGQYYIGTTITTEYDINITGYHHNSRKLLSGSIYSIPTSPSLIVIGANTSFEMIGRVGSGISRFCNFAIHNIKVIGLSPNSSFIKYSAAGSPSRVSIIEECEFTGLEYCIYLYANYADTMLGDLTISKCLAYCCGHFIYATSSSTSIRTLCNCIIKDCNLEQGGSHCIFIEHSFSSIIIDNNILEDQAEPIYINNFIGGLTISNNYTESNTGTVIYARALNLNSDITIKNNFFNEKIKVNISYGRLDGDLDKFTDDSIIQNCIVHDWKNFKIQWLPEEEYGSYILLADYNKGYGNIDSNPTTTKFGLLGYTLTSSYKQFSLITYTDVSYAACAFIIDGTCSCGFFNNGSGREAVIYGNKNVLVIFKQKLYKQGQNRFFIKGDKLFCSSIQYVTNNTDVQDILIPTSDITYNGLTRPSFNDISVGYSFFDQSLSPARIIYYKGDNVWVDATGTQV